MADVGAGGSYCAPVVACNPHKHDRPPMASTSSGPQAEFRMSPKLSTCSLDRSGRNLPNHSATGHKPSSGWGADDWAMTSKMLLYVPSTRATQPVTIKTTPRSFTPRRRPGTSLQNKSPGPMKHTKLPVVAPISSKIKLICGSAIATASESDTVARAMAKRTARVFKRGMW
mmetsp:Transcript_39038/g.107540  ORF Transcript_39038/g.107540 Transcript_39038/m.107540 type:complete len:171 (+) Transcript_39038:48-560(+)